MSNGGLIQIHHHTNLELLEKFTFKDGELYFDGVIVSREYTSEEIRAMIDELWNVIENPPVPPEEETPPGEVIPPDDTGDDTETELPEIPEGNEGTDGEDEEIILPDDTDEDTDIEVGGESGDTGESEGSDVPEQSQTS